MGIDRANHTKETVGTERNPASAENTAFDNQSTYSDSSYMEMQTSMEQVLAEYQQNIGMEPFRIGTELPDGSLSPSFVDHQASPSESNGWEKGELFHPSADAAVQYSQIEIGGVLWGQKHRKNWAVVSNLLCIPQINICLRRRGIIKL
jgi:hypothetical protein